MITVEFTEDEKKHIDDLFAHFINKYVQPNIELGHNVDYWKREKYKLEASQSSIGLLSSGELPVVVFLCYYYINIEVPQVIWRIEKYPECPNYEIDFQWCAGQIVLTNQILEKLLPIMIQHSNCQQGTIEYLMKKAWPVDAP